MHNSLRKEDAPYDEPSANQNNHGQKMTRRAPASQNIGGLHWPEGSPQIGCLKVALRKVALRLVGLTPAPNPTPAPRPASYS
jgi:hypothetical protein